MHAMGITLQQFKQMEERVTRGPRSVAPVFDSAFHTAKATAHKVILGLDPSLRGTGYGVIRLARPHPQTLVHGTIANPQAWERSRCLVQIVRQLRDVLNRCQPTVCVVESLFYAQNLQTAMIMGEARGAALSAVAEAG